MNKSRTFMITFFVSVIVFLTILYSTFYYGLKSNSLYSERILQQKSDSIINLKIELDSVKSSYFSEDNLKAYLVKRNVKYSEIVFNQAKLECGFTSYQFRKYNNLLGMRCSNRADSCINGYAYYKHWKRSVDCYKEWQDKHYKNPNENYYDFLVRIKYATGKDYVEMLKKMR